MEPREYETLESLEDRFWWYRGLHRLVLERVAERIAEHGAAPVPERTAKRVAERATERIPGRVEAQPRHADGERLRILDAGCGTGGMLRQLGAHYPGAELVGIDWSPHAVRRAARRAPRGSAEGTVPTAPPAPNRAAPGLARASVEALPFPAASFDLVVSLDVLYHAGVRDDVGALREFARVLRPGGSLVLNLPAFESLRSSHDRAIHTARRYRRAMLAERLTRAGLVPVRLHYWNGFLFPALAAVRWIRRGAAHPDRPVGPSDVRPLPAPANRALEFALGLERIWLRRAPLPFGLSLLAVARPGGSLETGPRDGVARPRVGASDAAAGRERR